MDGGRKSRYYTAILSGKNDRGLWSASTVEQFASSFLTNAGSNFTLHPECTRSQQNLMLTKANKLTCKLCWRSKLAKCFTIHSVDCGLPCHSKWQCSIWIPVHHLLVTWGIGHVCAFGNLTPCELFPQAQYWSVYNIHRIVTRPPQHLSLLLQATDGVEACEWGCSYCLSKSNRWCGGLWMRLQLLFV